MRRFLRLAAVVALCATPALAADLPRSSPEAQGVSSAALLEFVEAADRGIDSMNSLMVLRHGRVVAEGWWAPYAAGHPHSLYSLSKSFTSTAVGLAVAEGKLSVDDEVLKFFPDDAPADPGKNLRSMRVSDLLRMSTGHQEEPPRPRDQAWTKAFLAQPVPHKPGTHFLYNTSATYMLSAIVQKVTGRTVLDYLGPKLFDPLGIATPTWEASPQGVSAGGYGLSVRTEDIARFGQLYLQKGRWDGKQVVPESWVDAATARQTSNGSSPTSDWDQGYGYQFWRCRNGAYRGDGAFGQYCIVLPDQDAVIVITSGVGNMQGVLDLVWEKLLPAFKPSPMAESAAASEKLRSRLAGLTVRPQEGEGRPSTYAAKRYVFPANDRKIESVTLESVDGKVALNLRIDGADRRIVCGSGGWIEGRLGPRSFIDGRLGFGTKPEQPVAASGAWVAPDTFRAKLCFPETPFIITLDLKLDGDRLLLDARSNVGFGSARPPQLAGKAE